MEPLLLKNFKRLLSKLPVIGLDTSCLLYHIEQNPKYTDLTAIIFKDLLPNDRITAIGSTLLITETLALPFAQNRQDLIAAYKSLLLGFPNLKLYPLSQDVAERAGYLRGFYRLGTPDSIHLATTIEHGANSIVTNDKKWKKVKEIKTILLDEFAH